MDVKAVRSSGSGIDVTRELPNSVQRNWGPFNLAKHYKLNPHRVPQLAQYEVVIWIDGTLRVKLDLPRSPLFLGLLQRMRGQDANVACFARTEQGFPSPNRSRHTLEQELLMAGPMRKYHGQNFAYARRLYFGLGGINGTMREQWWLNDEASAALARMRNLNSTSGVWNTAMVVWLMRHRDTARLADAWWLENALTITQDQVTFPVAGWKTHIMPYTLPDEHGIYGYSGDNPIFEMYRHHA